MLNFGKYKGKTLLEIFGFDIQYVTWMANIIPNIDNRLDKEDRYTLHKYAYPYRYIEKNYGDIWNKDEEYIIKILQKEGFVYSAYSYIDGNAIMGVEGTVKTFYGSTFGSCSGLSNIDATHYPLIPTIRHHLNKADDWFKQYIANNN